VSSLKTDNYHFSKESLSTCSTGLAALAAQPCWCCSLAGSRDEGWGPSPRVPGGVVPGGDGQGSYGL